VSPGHTVGAGGIKDEYPPLLQERRRQIYPRRPTPQVGAVFPDADDEDVG